MSKFFSLLLLSCSVVSFSYDNIANFRNGDRLPTSTNHSSRNQDAKVDSHVFRESIPQLSSRSDLAKQGRIHHTYIHEVVFVVKQKNIDKLTLILHDVSDPRSVNYGQHMTREEIDTLTAIPEARAALLKYLQCNGAAVTSETLSGDYITAVAAISTWEKVLNTEFYTFHRTLEDGRIDKVVRAERYWIPKELDEHVESVFNTVQMPLWSNDRIPQVEVLEEDGGIDKLGYDQYPGYTTLSKIRQVYNVGNSKGSAASTQGIFASINQYFSPSDLASFQSDSGLSNQPVKSVPYGYSSDSQCVSDPNNCVEGNLDVQYIMGVSEGSPTTYWYSDQSFSGWLVSVANTPNPPLVISVSYGAYEVVMSSSEMNAFNTQAIKLSTMGVTLVVASGDDGAVVRGMNSFGIGYCAYYPVFPASCPYVTTVGATAGLEINVPETVCASDNGNTITSGGGFSAFFPQPAFQNPFVVKYLNTAAASDQTPYGGYNPDGRGYPDISLAGAKYLVKIGGGYFGISGTSASAPVIAGFFSNINAARIAAGKGSLGWVNPAIYEYSSQFINDITSGGNHCAADGLCCPQGFYAAPGWDPSTGLGTVDYGKMQSVFLGLGSEANGARFVPSAAPTYTAKPVVPTPSFRPTTKAPRTAEPFKARSARPSTSPPTATPTEAIFSSITVSQNIFGLTLTQISTPSFLAALQRTVSVAVKVPTTTVSVLAIAGGRRLLAAEITVSYSVRAYSGMSTDKLIANLHSSVDTGAFLIALKADSGLPIISMSGTVTTNLTPTASPTSSPLPSSEGASLTTIIAVAAAGAGVILIFLAVSLICCYCKKRNRYEGSPTNPRSVSPTPSACQSPSRPSSAAPTLVMVQSIAAADLPSIRRPIPVMALPVEQDSYMYPAHSPDRAAVRASPIPQDSYMYPAHSPDRAAVRASPIPQDSYMYPAHSPDRAAVRETSPTNY